MKGSYSYVLRIEKFTFHMSFFYLQHCAFSNRTLTVSELSRIVLCRTLRHSVYLLRMYVPLMYLVYISGSVHARPMHIPCTVVYFVWFLAFNPDAASIYMIHVLCTVLPKTPLFPDCIDVIDNPGEEEKLNNAKTTDRETWDSPLGRIRRVFRRKKCPILPMRHDWQKPERAKAER